MPTTAAETATLLVACEDRVGIIAALSDFVFRNGGNILDLDQHAERESGMFFMRLVWDVAGFALDRTATADALAALSARMDLACDLSYSTAAPNVAIFATKAPHCLYDLLLSHQLGELRCNIAAVVSNHAELRPVAEHFDVPYHHMPVARGEKATAEAAQLALLERLSIDLVVLARYMQILSPEFVSALKGQVINIHHSFLPAFIGARPYHQAKERGVKLIGATAHYVTAELDQGPIIEQDVTRVTHREDVERLVQRGSELERQVLTRAVKLHLERRVLVSGNRTIVFG